VKKTSLFVCTLKLKGVCLWTLNHRMHSVLPFVIFKLYFSDEEGEVDKECIETESRDDFQNEDADEEIASDSQASLERDSCVSTGTYW